MKTYSEMFGPIVSGLQEMDINENMMADAKKKLSKMKGKDVSFTHDVSGKKLTGKFKGLKNRGGRSYASIEVPGEGGFYIPILDVDQAQ